MTMKKPICALILLLLCLGLSACRREPEPPVIDDSSVQQTVPDNSEPDNSPEPDEPAQNDLSPVIEISAHELEAVVRFVSVYNAYPQPFSSVGELDDYALFFAAAARMNADFVPTQDGVTYSLSVMELEAAVRAIFGVHAALSDNWLQKDYSPYSVDAQAGVVLKTSLGTLSLPLYPYRCVKTAQGLELTMLCLSDPLFAGRYPEAAGGAESPTPEMFEEIAGQMMAYVYELSETDGGYILSGFQILNEKSLDTAPM